MNLQSKVRQRENVGLGGRDRRSMPDVLQAHSAYKIFVFSGRTGEQARVALRDVNLNVRRGEFLSLIGLSGCGKSTLLNVFAGLIPLSAGEVLHDGCPIRNVNTRVGYITQDDNLLPWRSMLANVELALELKGVARDARRAKALEYLARVGLEGREHHYPHELSGGMRKRVSIVRTLIDESVDVVLMDEPFGPLDAQTRLALQAWLLHIWQESGRTAVFVTHDLVEAIALSDRIAVFSSAPGTIKVIREVGIPRPRNVFQIHKAPGFSEIYDLVWNDLREEASTSPESAP